MSRDAEGRPPRTTIRGSGLKPRCSTRPTINEV
jgi:hypothetical protein